MDNSKERKKWDVKKLDKTMKNSKKEVVDLNLRLFNLVAEFGVRALKTFQAGKSEPLNPLQINQIVTREIQCVIDDLSKLQIADTIIKKAEQDFFNLGEKERMPLGK
jgi:hypothetical protein